MENLPAYIYIGFAATLALAIWLFRAAKASKYFLIIISALIVLQSVPGIMGFYSDPASMASRFPLLLLPALIMIIVLFLTKKGKLFIDSLDLKALTLFHSFRILIEIVLFWLFLYKTIPQAMTFEGRNFDMLSGLTAPFIYYFGFIKQKLSKAVLIGWNIACILLLLNVVLSAILALPGRYGQFGFEQPNIAVGFFPFLLLPAVLVPLALFANLAAARQLTRKK